jgi:hypothetical protein
VSPLRGLKFFDERLTVGLHPRQSDGAAARLNQSNYPAAAISRHKEY